MKKKSLFKRLSSVALAFLLSLSALTQGITASAFSDKNQATQQWLSTWSYDFRGSGLPKGYDIETGKYNDTHFTGYFASEVPYFTTSDNNYAYCINFDKLHNSGTVSKQQTLNDYMKNGHIPDDMQYQIKEFCIYSYKGKTQYGYSKDTELCASSVMSQAVSARFFDESTTGLSSNETKLLNAYSYNGSNASSHHNDLVDCYKKMKSEMLSHYDVPSGTSNNKSIIGKKATYPAKYDVKTGKWTATVKLDSSLSQFSVSKPNAVTSQKSGSQIILTADNEKDLKNIVITITKTKGKYVDHIDECSPLILSGGSDVQEMVVSCYEDKDPVKAYLKITTPIGSAHINKTFTDYFGNAQTATADMYKAVKFQLACKVGDGYSYTVTEIEAPTGYSLSAAPQTVKLASQQAEFVLDFYNTEWIVPFEITKTDVSTGELIPDCTFEILDENKNKVVTGVTDENGIAHFNLKYGKYFYREISAPEIYEIDNTPYPFEITEEGVTVKAKMTNKKKTGSIKVTKSTTGNLNIEGIKFIATGISDTNKDMKFEATTDENGVALFDKLVIGKYTVTEDGSTVPAAYLTADEQEVTVEYNKTSEVAFENIEKTGEIKVTKSTVGNLNIKGITFNLRGTSDSGRDIDIPAVTDENGIAVFSEIPIGTYTIYEDEKTVPTAYLVADPQDVTVTYAETKEVPIENEEKSGSITVHKTTEGQRNVEGITFYLKGTSDSGREINIPAVTDKDGIAKFENIPIGTYMVIEDEETVPYGYLVADEKEVKVEYAQTIDATILNNEQTGSITVHKTTEGQKNIEGIKFYLRGTSDTGREIDIPAITDENGIAKFENVPIGTYKVIEDKETVPYGYLVADEKEVKVEYAQTIDETILNNEQTGTVKVHKKTADMTNVEGIRFILSGISDTGREIRIEATTDKDGLAKFEGVPVGTYTITEDGSTVPYGYLVADSKQVTVAYAQTVDTDMVNEKAPDTPNTGVTDNDSDGSKALCSVAIILAGAAVLMFSRKRKER